VTCTYAACLFDISWQRMLLFMLPMSISRCSNRPAAGAASVKSQVSANHPEPYDPSGRLQTLQIGKVEEIFGGIQNAYFTVKMSEGVIATSYAAGDKFFIDPAKLLPLERFLPQPKGSAPRGGRGAQLGWQYCALKLRTRTPHMQTLLGLPAPYVLVQSRPWRN